MSKTLLERLTEIMRDRRYKSTRAFALDVDMDPSYFAKVLNGQKALPESLLETLHKKFGISKEWILSGEGSKVYKNGHSHTQDLMAPVGSHDYKDQYIQLQARTIQLLESQVKEKELLLEKVLARLDEISKDINMAAALQIGWQEFWTEHVPLKTKMGLADIRKSIHNKAFASFQNIQTEGMKIGEHR